MNAMLKTFVSMALSAMTLMAPAHLVYGVVQDSNVDHRKDGAEGHGVPPDGLVVHPDDSSRAGVAQANALFAKVQTRGAIRVIVGLNSGFQPEGELSTPQAVHNQRSANVRAQEAVLDRLASHQVAHVKQFQYIPYMAMEVDEAALAALWNDPTVTSIQEDVAVPPALAQSVPLINGNDVWAAGITGSGQVIAILDTGVASNHGFLNGGTVVAEACFSTTDAGQHATTVCPNGTESQTGTGAGVPCSVSGCSHGTHVAGIAAGSGTSFSGVARDADILAIQVFSRFTNPVCAEYGSSSPCILTFTSDQIRGLEHVYALRHTYAVAAINMSLGGGKATSPCDTDGRKSIIDNLRAAGIATVISAGNESYTSALGAPACISTAISVGSSGDGSLGATADTVSSFSNSANFLTLLAPGQWINSSVPGGGFDNYQGTSMAAPHVAGAFALLKQAWPSASVSQLLSALQSTGVSITDARNDITKPRIDVKAALDAVLALTSNTNVFPGRMCVQEGTSRTVFYNGEGRVLNYTTQPVTVICPIVRSNPTAKWDSVTVVVADRNPATGANVSCTAISAQNDGIYGGFNPETKTTTGADVDWWKSQTLTFGPQAQERDFGTYFLRCTIPARYQSYEPSGIYSYRLVE